MVLLESGRCGVVYQKPIRILNAVSQRDVLSATVVLHCVQFIHSTALNTCLLSIYNVPCWALGL